MRRQASRVRVHCIKDLFAFNAKSLVFVFVFVFARDSDILGNGISKDWWGFSNHVSAARVKWSGCGLWRGEGGNAWHHTRFLQRLELPWLIPTVSAGSWSECGWVGTHHIQYHWNLHFKFQTGQKVTKEQNKKRTMMKILFQFIVIRQACYHIYHNVWSKQMISSSSQTTHEASVDGQMHLLSKRTHLAFSLPPPFQSTYFAFAPYPTLSIYVRDFSVICVCSFPRWHWQDSINDRSHHACPHQHRPHLMTAVILP